MKCLVFDRERGIARIENRDDVTPLGDPALVDLSDRLREKVTLCGDDDLAPLAADGATFAAWVHRLFCDYIVSSRSVTPSTAADSALDILRRMVARRAVR